MEQEILDEARQQVGYYLQEIMNQKGWTRTYLAERSGLIRAQIQWILEGSRSYTIDSFLKVIRALDCYFYLANREKKHLDYKDMIDKINLASPSEQRSQDPQ